MNAPHSGFLDLPILIAPLSSPIYIRKFSFDISLPLKDFGDVYETKLLSDAVLIVNNGKTFAVHKLILAMNSEYFKLLFVNNFKNTDNIYHIDTNEVVLEQYLQLIYKRQITIDTNWRDVIAVFKFIDFTQTHIPELPKLLTTISIPGKEYGEFLNAIIELYQGEIPLEFIQFMNEFDTDYLNFKELGEEFTRTLIESARDESDKYDIAQKAVKDGLDPSIYYLVQYERLYPPHINPESIPYLKHINEDLLTNDIVEAKNLNLPFTAAIINQRRYGIDDDMYNIRVRGKLHDRQLVLDLVVDENGILMNENDRISIDKLQAGTILEIQSYNLNYIDLNRIRVNEFQIVEY